MIHIILSQILRLKKMESLCFMSLLIYVTIFYAVYELYVLVFYFQQYKYYIVRVN